MAKSIQSLHSLDLKIGTKQTEHRLERVRNQIVACVSKARHYVKLIELLDKKVEELAFQEQELLLLLEKDNCGTFH